MIRGSYSQQRAIRYAIRQDWQHLIHYNKELFNCHCVQSTTVCASPLGTTIIIVCQGLHQSDETEPTQRFLCGTQTDTWLHWLLYCFRLNHTKELNRVSLVGKTWSCNSLPDIRIDCKTTQTIKQKHSWGRSTILLISSHPIDQAKLGHKLFCDKSVACCFRQICNGKWLQFCVSFF